jgi:hypothetical protein
VGYCAVVPVDCGSERFEGQRDWLQLCRHAQLEGPPSLCYQPHDRVASSTWTCHARIHASAAPGSTRTSRLHHLHCTCAVDSCKGPQSKTATPVAQVLTEELWSSHDDDLFFTIALIASLTLAATCPFDDIYTLPLERALRSPSSNVSRLSGPLRIRSSIAKDPSNPYEHVHDRLSSPKLPFGRLRHTRSKPLPSARISTVEILHPRITARK